MNFVKQNVKFDNRLVVNLVGMVGGMAVLWKNGLQVKKILFTSFTIELLIEYKEVNTDRQCICIYGSTDDGIRREQYKFITKKKQLWGDSWAIMGDFNNIRSNGENGIEKGGLMQA